MKRRSFVGYVLLVLATAGTLESYDTGHHRDLTVMALRDEAFSPSSADIVALQNWITDFYAGHTEVDFRVLGVDVNTHDLLPYNLLVDHTSRLHFDNLRSARAVRNYWYTLARNMRCAIYVESGRGVPEANCSPFPQRAPGTNPDPLRILTLLGMSLHAVQDFYSHSNWVEILQDAQPLPQGRYHTLTWFDYARSGQHSGRFDNLRSGDYGLGTSSSSRTHHNNMNHDFYARKNWDRSFVMAYVASREWINQVRLWAEEAKPHLWDDCIRSYVAPSNSAQGDLNNGLDAAFTISSLLGHWKGPDSAAPLTVASAGKSFISTDSRYRNQFEKEYLFLHLTYNLAPEEINKLASVEPIAVADHHLVDPAMAVRLRTTVARNGTSLALLGETNASQGDADRVTARISFGLNTDRETFEELTFPTQDGTASLPKLPWQTVFFGQGTSYDIGYELIYVNRVTDTVRTLDINPDVSHDTLAFQFSVPPPPSLPTCIIGGQLQPCSSGLPWTQEGPCPAMTRQGGCPSCRACLTAGRTDSEVNYVRFYVEPMFLQPPTVPAR